MQLTLELRPELIDKLEDIALDEDMQLDVLIEEYLESMLAKSSVKPVRSAAYNQSLSDILSIVNSCNCMITAEQISNQLSLSLRRVRDLCNTLIVAGKIKFITKKQAKGLGTINYYFHLGFVVEPKIKVADKNAVYQHIYNNPGCELYLLARNMRLPIVEIGEIVQELLRDKKIRAAEKQLKAGASLTILFCC